ncbi:MAG: hypothetical protein AAFO07_18110 [Bacteroidota bacterium]
MYELDQKYIDKLEQLAAEIQGSEELNQYLEDEEEEQFIRLKEMYEPRIALLYEEVAANHPLQLIPLELLLLEPIFEGLYLPRVLGYSVLRGEVNERVKYARPQEHFKEVLVAICQSANFDILKKRIGQSIQVGFALSSDIWVTNLINAFDNKRIRYYLQSQKLDRYRVDKERNTGLVRYKRQFRSDNYMTAEFPDSLGSLKVLYPSLKSFLLYRIGKDFDNESINDPMQAFIENKEFQNSLEHLHLMMIYGYFFKLDEERQADLADVLNEVRVSMPDFSHHFLSFVLELHDSPNVELTPEADLKMSALMDRDVDDELTKFFDLLDTVHNTGYTEEAAQDAIKKFYNQHEGLSVINSCIRRTIFRYLKSFISNLEVNQYAEYFSISKLFPVYIGIFANQQFNQDLKEVSMRYIRKLLKVYTDKRGKDYQDIKKFVTRVFSDLEFLKDKEIVELFKTRRKKKPATPKE